MVAGQPIKQIRQWLKRMLVAVNKLPDNPDPTRTGFVFVVYNTNTEQYYLGQIGTIPPGKLFKYTFLALEKAWRLLQNPEHLTSRQSADPDAEKWPGAVRVDDYIISISGLTPDADEALPANLGWLTKHITATELQALAELTRNPLVLPVHDQVTT